MISPIFILSSTGDLSAKARSSGALPDEISRNTSVPKLQSLTLCRFIGGQARVWKPVLNPVRGRVVRTTLRGVVAWEEGVIKAAPGTGRLLPC